MASHSILQRGRNQPNQPPFPLVPATVARLVAAAAGGNDQFPECPRCGEFHSESYECRPPWLGEHLDSRDPGIPNS